MTSRAPGRAASTAAPVNSEATPRPGAAPQSAPAPLPKTALDHVANALLLLAGDREASRYWLHLDLEAVERQLLRAVELLEAGCSSARRRRGPRRRHRRCDLEPPRRARSV